MPGISTIYWNHGSFLPQDRPVRRIDSRGYYRRCVFFDAVSYKRRVWPERRPASPNTKDALTGEYHETRVADLALAAKVADALDNIDRYLRSTGG